MSIVSERTRHSDAICIAALKVTLERPRGFSRGQKRLRWSRGRERERERGVARRSGDSIFSSARVESRHTRPQVG